MSNMLLYLYIYEFPLKYTTPDLDDICLQIKCDVMGETVHKPSQYLCYTNSFIQSRKLLHWHRIDSYSKPSIESSKLIRWSSIRDGRLKQRDWCEWDPVDLLINCMLLTADDELERFLQLIISNNWASK